jgi:hypothetical protein
MGPRARPKCRWEKDPKTGSQSNITPIIVFGPQLLVVFKKDWYKPARGKPLNFVSLKFRATFCEMTTAGPLQPSDSLCHFHLNWVYFREPRTQVTKMTLLHLLPVLAVMHLQPTECTERSPL